MDKLYVHTSSGWDYVTLKSPSKIGPTLALCGDVLVNHITSGLNLTPEKETSDGDVFGEFLKAGNKDGKCILHITRQGYARMEEIGLTEIWEGMLSQHLDNLCFVVEGRVSMNKGTFILDAYYDSGTIDFLENAMEREKEIDLGDLTEIHIPASWVEMIEPYEDLTQYLKEQNEPEQDEAEAEKEVEVYV